MSAKTWMAALALSAVAVAWDSTPTPTGPLNPAQGPNVVQAGRLLLAWDLPSAGQNSLATGVAYLGASSPRYTFTATLVDLTPSCSTCVFGAYQGELSDGVGSGPDYVVRGFFSGSLLGGDGRFGGGIFHPVTNERVGRLGGEFLDPASVPAQIGVAAGSWYAHG
jgi:hypothetical protein